MTLATALRVLPAVLLTACCCCNIDWLIPDSVGDAVGEAVGDAVEEAVAEAVVEQGFGLATGGSLDIEDGKIAITSADGEKLVIGEGADSVDARMPLTPHLGCPISGGFTGADADSEVMMMAQANCDVPFADLAQHYEPQLKALGGSVQSVTPPGHATQTVQRILQVKAPEKGFESVQVILGQDAGGKTSAVVAAKVEQPAGE